MGPSLSPLKGGEGKRGFLVFCYEPAPDCLKHSGEVFQHLIVPEPNNAIAVARNLSGPRRVFLPLYRVLATIDLDCALAGGTREIDYVRTYRMLSPKAAPGEAFPKRTPQPNLHFGRIPTQTASNVGSLYCLYTSKTQGIARAMSFFWPNLSSCGFC